MQYTGDAWHMAVSARWRWIVFLITDKDGVRDNNKTKSFADSVPIATNGIKYKKKPWTLQVTDNTM